MDTTTLPADASQLIPQSAIDSMATVFAISIIISMVFLALFVVMYTISQIRRWKVDNAILAMRKDLHEIKSQLSASGPTAVVAVAAQPPLDPHDPAA